MSGSTGDTGEVGVCVCWGQKGCLYFVMARKPSAPYVKILPVKDKKDFFFP